MLGWRSHLRKESRSKPRPGKSPCYAAELLGSLLGSLKRLLPCLLYIDCHKGEPGYRGNGHTTGTPATAHLCTVHGCAPTSACSLPVFAAHLCVAMASEYKLGPALVGAPGITAHVPKSFRAALLRDLDGPARLNLALTCNSAFELLATEWSTAQLTVPVRSSSEEKRDVLLRRLRSAKVQFALRQGLRTTLMLRQRDRIDRGDTWWQYAFAVLGAGVYTHAKTSLSRAAPRSKHLLRHNHAMSDTFTRRYQPSSAAYTLWPAQPAHVWQPSHP